MILLIQDTAHIAQVHSWWRNPIDGLQQVLKAGHGDIFHLHLMRSPERPYGQAGEGPIDNVAARIFRLKRKEINLLVCRPESFKLGVTYFEGCLLPMKHIIRDFPEFGLPIRESAAVVLLHNRDHTSVRPRPLRLIRVVEIEPRLFPVKILRSADVRFKLGKIGTEFEPFPDLIGAFGKTLLDEPSYMELLCTRTVLVLDHFDRIEVELHLLVNIPALRKGLAPLFFTWFGVSNDER